MKKVAIVGAGISGLFFANLLRQNHNYEISIYEKSNSIKLEKGYGLQLSVNSIELLNKIGFKNLNSLNQFNPKKIDFYSLLQNKKICDLDISIFNTNEAKYTTMQRSILVEFLKEKLPSNLTQYNKTINKIDTTNNNIEYYTISCCCGCLTYITLYDNVVLSSTICCLLYSYYTIITRVW